MATSPTMTRQENSTVASLDQEHAIIQYDSPFSSKRNQPSSVSPSVSARRPGSTNSSVRQPSIRQGPAHTAWVASALSSPHTSVRAGTPVPAITGRRATISAEYMTPIINVLNDPLSCGFFLAFCRMQHAVENILFIMECDRFKDLMSGDKRCWTERYSELDKRIFNGPKSAEFRTDMDEEMRQKVERPEWPSKVVHRRFVDKRLKEIWESYISAEADTEICISDVMRARTRVRMNLVHLYGADLFNESLYDPYLTLRNDIMPRFLMSQIYGEMNARINFCYKLPAANTLVVAPPDDSESPLLKEKIEDFPDTRLFDLNEIISDAFLYDEFLKHLRAGFCPENLFCIRKVKEYETMYKAWRPDPPPSPSPHTRRQQPSLEAEGGTTRGRTLRNSLVMSVQQAGDTAMSIAAAVNENVKKTRGSISIEHNESNRRSSQQNGSIRMVGTLKDDSRGSFKSLPTGGNQMMLSTKKINKASSFRATAMEKPPTNIENCAWLIYRYFVAPGAAYEINLSVRQRKDIMIALARPERKMFDVLKASAYGFLETNFNSYKFTDEYTNLVKSFRPQVWILC